MRSRVRATGRGVVRSVRTVTAAELVASAARTVPLVGLLVAVALLGAYAPVPGLGLVVGVVAVLLVGWLFLSTAIGLVFVAALMIAWGFVSASVDALVLDERGITTTCTVLDVAVRTVTTSGITQFGPGTDPFGPFGPGGPPSSSGSHTTTYYDHHLRCADGRLDAMTLTHRAADDGQRLDVVYDPTDRVSPQPADDVARPDSAGRTLWVTIALTVLVGLVDGVWSGRNRW